MNYDRILLLLCMEKTIFTGMKMHHDGTIFEQVVRSREIFCPLKESGCSGFDSVLDLEHYIFI